MIGAIVAGRLAVKFFTKPMKTDSKRFRQDTGWKPRFATYEAGLDEVVRHWKAEDFPPERKPPATKGKGAPSEAAATS